MNNENFQQQLYENNKWDYQAKKNAAILYKLVKKHVRNGILDIGAADASLIKYLKTRGFTNVHGFDLVPKSAEIIQGSITEIPFTDNSFSTAFSTEVFEHLADEQIEKGLAEIKRILKPEGKLILTVPFEENFAYNWIVCPHCNKEFHKYGHLQYFDEKRMNELLQKNGFKVVFIKPFALGAMGFFPFGRYLNFVFKRLKYESISITLIVVATYEQ